MNINSTSIEYHNYSKTSCDILMWKSRVNGNDHCNFEIKIEKFKPSTKVTVMNLVFRSELKELSSLHVVVK